MLDMHARMLYFIGNTCWLHHGPLFLTSPCCTWPHHVHVCCCRPAGATDVEVTLSPEELEGLDNEGIRALYEAKVAAAQAAAKAEREDFSDMVARHAAAQKRKIQERADTRAAKKQKDSFKF